MAYIFCGVMYIFSITTKNLARDTIISSSNSDAAVDFSVATTKDVFCTMPASKVAYIDDPDQTINAAGKGFALAVAIAL